MRKKAIIGNWKMNKTSKETTEFISSFLLYLQAHHRDVIIGIAPSFLSLDAAVKTAQSQFLIFSQNCHEEEKGAFTGEISLSMLEEIGIDGSIIGHSERRQYYLETSEGCNRKIKALLHHHLIPLYCVGESLSQYEQGETKSYIESQLITGLEGIDPNDFPTMMIAYEPIWSIGTGRNATKEIAQDICGFIREVIAKKSSKEIAEKVLILYGGSVKPENVGSYLSAPDIDGVLVGGASLTVPSFQSLIDSTTGEESYEL